MRQERKYFPNRFLHLIVRWRCAPGIRAESFRGTEKELVDPHTASVLASVMPEYTFGSLSVRAKTGTAEVGEDKRPNAWMVGFSTDQDAPLAFACVVEEAGFGSQYARPIAETAMQKCAEAIRGY